MSPTVPTLALPDGSCDIRELLHEPPRAGNCSKAITFVELEGVLVDGIHDDEPCRNRLGRRHDSAQRFSKQRSTQRSALKGLVQGETSKKDGWNLVGTPMRKGSR